MTSRKMTVQGQQSFGFRFSRLDLSVLCGSVVLAMQCWSWARQFSVLLLFVLSHFFLFCNVFRIHRIAELVWAAVFIVNCLISVSFQFQPMLAIGCTQAVVIISILAWELTRPSYHGVFSTILNPHLKEYLGGQSSTDS